MNKHQRFAIALTGLFLILISGCIPSIHPIYTKDKLVTVKELSGTWSDAPGDISFNKKQKIGGQEKDMQVTIHQQAEDRPEIWKFIAQEDKQYLLVHTDKEGKTAAFDIHVVKLGDNLFMDFYPGDLPEGDKGIGGVLEGTGKLNDLQELQFFPVHIFAKLEVGQKELKISMFDPDFLKKLMERQQIRIKHEKTNDGYILTASPEELQKFAEKYAYVKEAFLDEPIVLSKK